MVREQQLLLICEGGKTMVINVSPRYSLDTDSRKVTESGPGGYITHDSGDPDLPLKIFQDRMNGWFFDPAKRLLLEGGSVAAVHIVTPLIEALEERYEGKSSNNQSTEYFIKRAKIIFPIDDEAITLLHKGLRCGFAHHGFLKDDYNHYNILITSNLAAPIEFSDKVLNIDADKYVDFIKEAHEIYYKHIQQDAELQSKFMAFWIPDWQMSLRVPGGCGTVNKESV